MGNTFTNNPQASHTLAVDQPNILANFAYVANTLGTSLSSSKDHQVSIGGIDTNTGEGRHLRVSFRDNGALTYPGDGTDAFMYSTGGQIFWGNASLGTTTQQLTTSNATLVTNKATFGTLTTYTYSGQPGSSTCKGGWTFLPGGLIMQYGSLAASSGHINPGVTFEVNFPFIFPSNVFNITTSLFNGASFPSSSSGVGNISIQATTITTTLFNVQLLSTSSQYTGFYWWAIGN